MVTLSCGVLCAQGIDEPESTGGVFSWPVLEKSGFIGICIAILAFVMLTLAVYFLIALRARSFIPQGLLANVSELIQKGEIRQVVEQCGQDTSLLARSLSAGLSRRADGYVEMVEAVEALGQEESMRLLQSVGYLGLIAAVSPMLGLLGTVYGMIASFQAVADQAGNLQPGLLAAGIYTALTTTLMGLIVAIPAMSAQVYFRNRVLNLLNESAAVVEEILYPFKKKRVREVVQARPLPSATSAVSKPAPDA